MLVYSVEKRVDLFCYVDTLLSMMNKNIKAILFNIISFVGGVFQYLVRPAIITILWNYVVVYGTDWPKITFVVIFEIIFRVLITYIPYKMMYMTPFPTTFPQDPDDDINEKYTDTTDTSESNKE